MVEESFDWRTCISRPNFIAAPVSCFKHVSLSQSWDNIFVGAVVEVRSPDCVTCRKSSPCCYWIARITKISGYMGLLRFEGFEHDSSQDFWMNLCSSNIHPLGWCAESGMPLVPPKCIEDKHVDWKDHLVLVLPRTRTLPPDFSLKVEEQKHSTIKKGMKVEAVDKNLISAVRPATVVEVVGGRLCLEYDGAKSDDKEFWCHEKSLSVHPVGWACLVGHDLNATPEYGMQSMNKILHRVFDPTDATPEMFPPPPHCVQSIKFKEGMKLEAVDQSNMSNICVATVKEVLKHNYVMIIIDTIPPSQDTEPFCVHASSPYIFPIGFCESNLIPLVPPKGFKGEFKWQDYLRTTKAKPAPYPLFQHEIPNHSFIEGMYLEAVDLMEPRLICVATVVKVIGNLLRIHFEGWDEVFDQWCDCGSLDIFPVGWCEIMGYRLEPPKIDETEERRGRKPIAIRGRRGRRRMRRKLEEDFEPVTIKQEPEDSNDCEVITNATSNISLHDFYSGLH